MWETGQRQNGNAEALRYGNYTFTNTIEYISPRKLDLYANIDYDCLNMGKHR